MDSEVREPMIFVVDAANRRHFATDLAAMHCHRKAVFVDRAGWKLPVIADLEIDRYDLLEDTVYLLAKDEPPAQYWRQRAYSRLRDRI